MCSRNPLCANIVYKSLLLWENNVREANLASLPKANVGGTRSVTDEESKYAMNIFPVCSRRILQGSFREGAVAERLRESAETMEFDLL